MSANYIVGKCAILDAAIISNSFITQAIKSQVKHNALWDISVVFNTSKLYYILYILSNATKICIHCILQQYSLCIF